MLDVPADTARSRLLVNGQDVQDAGWLETWGAEFKEKMPEEIKAEIDEVIAKAKNGPDGRQRQRILERLQKIRELLRPSRYRRDPDGLVNGSGDVSGGDTASGVNVKTGERRPCGGSGGRGSDLYLADLVEINGEPAVKVHVNPVEPEVV